MDNQQYNPKEEKACQLDELWTTVKESLHLSWTAEKLAKQLNTSPSTLLRITKKKYGMTPGALLMKYKMEQARVLLKDTNYPLRIVAEHLGYSNAFVFSNTFKHKYSVSPRDYRRQQQQETN